MYSGIRELREDKDLSQTEIAKIRGMSQTGYSKYETGENDVPAGILIASARYYRTSTDYILGLASGKNRIPGRSAGRGTYDARAKAKAGERMLPRPAVFWLSVTYAFWRSPAFWPAPPQRWRPWRTRPRRCFWRIPRSPPRRPPERRSQAPPRVPFVW